jgi:hypothetical protein
MWIGNWFQIDANYQRHTEGFVDFNYSSNSTGGTPTYIPQYSGSDKTNMILNLYDNLYFDNKNGNLIEVQSTTTHTNESSGNTISKIFVTNR